ncbi:hypothetical protein KAM622c_16770 [Klebsiella quasipneumoniae subsp. quasipneumoniae]|nr:dTDP-4-dehydrorhamnose 3,5-epimerase family protein [Klebsiella quasipneumoniae]BDO02090.1 hypothetical protein KAM622c_16770 [Klebsiella quasipneumoniae subsp. quasipneumoniae]
MALSDTVQFVYKATNYYAPQSERSIISGDPEIGIDLLSKRKTAHSII